MTKAEAPRLIRGQPIISMHPSLLDSAWPEARQNRGLMWAGTSRANAIRFAFQNNSTICAARKFIVLIWFIERVLLIIKTLCDAFGNTLFTAQVQRHRR